jgi:hypothetical protein
MRTVLRSKVTLLFIVCAALLAFGGTAMALVSDPSGNTSATTTSSSPTITSDKADYAPGELVTLTGGNWQAGESVNIKVNDTYGATWSRNVDVTADSSGNITDSFNLPNTFVSDYDVTATGAQSGTATTTFTAAAGTKTTLTSSPNPSNTGSAVTFTATVSCDPIGNGCTFSSGNTMQLWEGVNSNCGGQGGATLLGTVSQSSFSGSGSSRTATFTINSLSAGTHSTIMACFNGGGPGTSAGSSNSSFLTQTVNAVTTTSVSDITASASTFGGTTNLSAKVSPLNAPGSVEFFVNGSSTAATGTVNYNQSTGVATLSNYSHGLNASATPYSVKAVFTPSNSSYSSSNATNTTALTVGKANQTITFAQPTTPQTFGATFHVNPTSDSGLAVSLTDSGNGVCSVQSVASGGYDVTMTSGTGNCVLTASQAGNANYNAAANVQRTVAAQKKNQTITGFGAIANKVVGTTFPVSATASSGLNVSFSASGSCTVSGNTVSVTGVGPCTITASQGGNSNYNAAPNVTQTFNGTYTFTGFASPVDNNNVLNSAKAGQAIPLKWRLTDASGNPVTNLSGVTVTVKDLNCALGTTTDALEEYAAGSSGLQNLGDGYYQFNWKSPTNYASSCKTVHVNVGEGTTASPVTHTALFKFTK